MHRSAAEVTETLFEAFPQRVIRGVITPHECEECSAIRTGLAGLTWRQVPDAFAEKFAGSLPLLSPDAYNAYLPVWLRAAVNDPNGEAASMIAINLSNEPSREGFTRSQAEALIAAVEYVASNNIWGAEDECNVERLAAVRASWSEGVA
jgi:hypothetical protein